MTTTLRPLALAAAILAGACLSPTASAAESYDNCTGFIDTLPATITTQGVWCLRKNLTTAMTTGAAITIAGNNITIDCNEYKIGGLQGGSATQAYGIHAEFRVNTTIRNCGIRGFSRAIWLYGDGGGHLVERNRLDQNYYAGMIINGEGNRAIDNRVFDTGGSPSGVVAYGIYIEGDAVDNTVSTIYGLTANMTAHGIVAYGIGAEVRGNRVRNLLATGTGFARGVSAMAHNMTVAGNRVSNESVAPNISRGVYAQGNDIFCINNTVGGYTTTYEGCDHVAGNLPVSP